MVTATRRLARFLREQDDRRQLAAGAQAWLPLDVLPWEAWLEREWRRCRGLGATDCDHRLLSVEQERVVWEQVTGSLPGLDALLMPGQAAREAMNAWGLVKHYAISRETLTARMGPDTRLFVAAADRFGERCREQSWALSADLAWQLAAAIKGGTPSPGRLLLAGFDRFTPAQSHLLECLRATGVHIETWAPTASTATPRVLACADPARELAAAADWAAAMVRARPDSIIGLVLLDLEQRRDAVVDALGDAMAPAQVLPGFSSEPRAWNLSLGLPLCEWSLIDTALLSLSLCLRRGSHTDIGRLLRSPYLGDGMGEAGQRALLDLWLREQGVCELDLSGLSRLSSGDTGGRRPMVPALAARLQTLDALEVDRRDPRTMDQWAGLFGRVLTALGWPGERPLSSAEFQTVAKWRELLARLAGLATVSGRVRGVAALEQLRRMATDTLFQPETPSAPVQVLGLRETPGMHFDALWVGGLHDQAWPRPLRPNPLLPVSVQREAAMPRCCPQTELEFARTQSLAMADATGELIFSWPRAEQDEVLRPSSLLTGLPTAEAEPGRAGLAPLLQASGRLQSLNDYRMRPWPATRTVRGGSGVLRSQSACPFQAQARYRLRATDIPVPTPGISPLQSGQIVHLALQTLWLKWQGPEQPRAMDAEARRDAVDTALAAAVRQTLGGTADAIPAMLELERARWRERILQLLEQDLRREPFRIEALEADSEAQLGGLNLRMRLDRVDRLDGGDLLYLDYKTGRAAVGDWLGERPREPQLPMYAVLGPQAVAGVAFGSLAVGDVGYRGLARNEIAGTGILSPGSARHIDAADWDALRERWERDLSQLAQAFAAGDARVDPRRTSEDCRWCQLSILCRRHELQDRGALEDA